MVQRDEFWFKFRETILFEHIGDVEQVKVNNTGQVDFKYMQQLVYGMMSCTLLWKLDLNRGLSIRHNYQASEVFLSLSG
jgi:hypothetical protein